MLPLLDEEEEEDDEAALLALPPVLLLLLLLRVIPIGPDVGEELAILGPLFPTATKVEDANVVAALMLPLEALDDFLCFDEDEADDDPL